MQCWHVFVAVALFTGRATSDDPSAVVAVSGDVAGDWVPPPSDAAAAAPPPRSAATAAAPPPAAPTSERSNLLFELYVRLYNRGVLAQVGGPSLVVTTRARGPDLASRDR